MIMTKPNRPQLSEEIKRDVTISEDMEFNKKIIPILISGFRIGGEYDELFVAEQIRKLFATAIEEERERYAEAANELARLEPPLEFRSKILAILNGKEKQV